MKISVVMVDGSFREKFHIINSLNNQTFPKEDFEMLWVEFYNKANTKLKENGNVRIIVLGNSSEKEYHSSYCFNEGIRQSRGEVLVIPDADVLVEPSFLETIWKEHQSCTRLAMYFHRLNEPRELHDENKSFTLDHLKNLAGVTTTSNFGGCLTLRKKWLMEINGYEQNVIFGSGAHANGYDVNTRLKNLGLHVMWHPIERLYHPWHPGTSTHSPRYKLQHLIVEYRASNMMTTTFQGIDPSRDSAFPECLQQRLRDAEIVSAGDNSIFSWIKAKLKLTMAFIICKKPPAKREP